MKQEIVRSGMIFPAFANEGRKVVSYLPITNVPLTLPPAYMGLVANPEFKPDSLIEVVNVSGPAIAGLPVAHKPLYVDHTGRIYKSAILPHRHYEATDKDFLGRTEYLKAKIGALWERRWLTPTDMTLEHFQNILTDANKLDTHVEPRYNGFSVFFPRTLMPARASRTQDFRFAEWETAEISISRMAAA